MKSFFIILAFFSSTSPHMIFYSVDKNHSLPAAYEPNDLIEANIWGVPAASEVRFSKKILKDLKKMILHARKEGINLFITSGYRSYEKQQSVFEYWKKREIRKNNLNEEEAEKKVASFCAYPGHSEHQLGTALDILDGKERKFDHTPANEKIWNWLALHREEYGFVLSYPKNKTDKTGYIFEPWHLRWIGRKHAQELKKLDYCNQNNDFTVASYLRKKWYTIPALCSKSS